MNRQDRFIKPMPCHRADCPGKFEITPSGQRNCMGCTHELCPIIPAQRVFFVRGITKAEPPPKPRSVA